MIAIVAFCYNYHFSNRKLIGAANAKVIDNEDGSDFENCWIGVGFGGKHHEITTRETNEFLAKYLIDKSVL